MTNGSTIVPPDSLRRLDTAGASTLVGLLAMFEDLQTVLRCCERLVAELADTDEEPDDVLIEGVWTMALLSYARCFAVRPTGGSLTESDLAATSLQGAAVEWHHVLLQLRNYHADPLTNPREQFSVGVALDADGAASGIAVTSARHPLVDELTVRQTGAIAFALSALVDERIALEQKAVLAQASELPKADLDKLSRLEVAQSD